MAGLKIDTSSAESDKALHGPFPQAYSFNICYCENPECNVPHLVAFDKNDNVLADIPLWEPQVVIEEIQKVLRLKRGFN